MIITDISEQKRNKNRCNVYVDGAYSFAASKECILKNNLQLESEITKDVIEKILLEDEYRKALDYAVKRLSYKQFSKKELTKVLQDKGYDGKTIEKVQDKLSEYSYINDKELSRMIVSDSLKVKKLGKRAIYSNMMKKKIDPETAKAALENIAPETEAENSFDVLYKYAKRYDYTGNDLKTKQKICRALIRKGYNWDLINDAFQRFEDENEED